MTTMKLAPQCSLCGSTNRRVFLTLPAMPALACALWRVRDEALHCPKGDIELCFCRDCGFIENRRFDPELTRYSDAYENSLGFSHVFQGYADQLATKLLERHELHGKRIIEIGSGDAQFLVSLCERGDNTGMGFDPSYNRNSPDTLAGGRVKIVREHYSERHAQHQADLIIARHVLEHIPDPVDFLARLRRVIGPRRQTALFFEVPNILPTLIDILPWDLIYEHCSSFSAGTLARTFAQAGFDVAGTEEAYARQFLSIDAVPSLTAHGKMPSSLKDLTEVGDRVSRFATLCPERIVERKKKIQALARAGKKVVLWGAGARGISYLNILALEEEIEYIVDINPRKHGTYVPGTGQRIVPPTFLREYRPDLVIVMNPNYTLEIAGDLEKLGVACPLERP